MLTLVAVAAPSDNDPGSTASDRAAGPSREPGGSPGRGALRYAAYYCEENIWQLCAHPELQTRDARVAFVSNPNRSCALWAQRAASQPGAPVVWDYHVVLLARDSAEWMAWDLDTLVGLPVPASQWLAHTFLPLRDQYSYLAPRFRLLEPAAYRAGFSSDRSHMLEPDGSWKRPPPSWPAIVTPDAPSFLRWSEMSESDPGCLTLDGLRAFLSS